MKRFILPMLVLALLLTGCGNSDYEKATALYKEGNYESAMALFEQLGNYEDSAEKVLQCRYAISDAALEAGNYESAMALFEQLGDYEDSAEKVLRCRYAISDAALEVHDFETALNGFTELGDYRDSPDRRQEAAWKALYSRIDAAGEPLSCVHKSTKEQVITTTLATVSSNPDQLVLSNSNLIQTMGITQLSELAITVTRGKEVATFQTHTELEGLGTISRKDGDGTLNLSSATANTQLNPNNYLYFYTDIFGKSHSETEMDATERSVLQEHYTYILQGVSALLEETGLPVTLADLGFSAMG